VFENSSGIYAIQDGKAEGVLLGGNLSSIRLLYGTDYMPDFDDQPLVLYLEDDSEINKELTGVEFDRNFESVRLQPWFKRVQAILIGRFEKSAELDLEELSRHLLSKKLNIPIVANLDFGHTTPFFTLPNGLTASLDAQNWKTNLEVRLR
jgi:muramoyltetrapeptide carboxypeptidase LdcA involved in peptidoglycan recycling